MADALLENSRKWELRLYIAGETRRSKIAMDNLKKICHEHLEGLYHIEVINLSEHPELAVSKQITAIPTLIKELPLPVRTIIGDLSATEKVLVGLDIKPKL